MAKGVDCQYPLDGGFQVGLQEQCLLREQLLRPLAPGGFPKEARDAGPAVNQDVDPADIRIEGRAVLPEKRKVRGRPSGRGPGG